jgi:hypothetical protein
LTRGNALPPKCGAKDPVEQLNFYDNSGLTPG